MLIVDYFSCYLFFVHFLRAISSIYKQLYSLLKYALYIFISKIYLYIYIYIYVYIIPSILRIVPGYFFLGSRNQNRILKDRIQIRFFHKVRIRTRFFLRVAPELATVFFFFPHFGYGSGKSKGGSVSLSNHGPPVYN